MLLGFDLVIKVVYTVFKFLAANFQSKPVSDQKILNPNVNTDISFSHSDAGINEAFVNDKEKLSMVAVYLDMKLTLLFYVLSWCKAAYAESMGDVATACVVLTQVYIKIPFVFYLAVHLADYYQYVYNYKQIYPKNNMMEFQTYKDKVLFLIRQVIGFMGQSSTLSRQVKDLTWCTFVIENDFLQISNSISSAAQLFPSILPEEEKVVPSRVTPVKQSRRFSKTISTHFGQRNKKQIVSFKLKKISQFSSDCFQGCLKTNIEALQDFNRYFNQEAYDAFQIDKAVNGNLLTFTMMYIYHRLNWKQELPKMNEEKYLNMAYKMQNMYRPNFYHNQVHAADVA